MALASRDLQTLLSHLGITADDLAGFSETQIDNSLERKGIVEPVEIACVKNRWKEQRQSSGVFLKLCLPSF